MSSPLVRQGGVPPALGYGAIGLLAGFSSALFGIGGGFIVVPLLIAWLAFPPKLAIGTSLVAVGITAMFGTAAFQLIDAVDWQFAATIGLPGAVGTLLGTWLQQRVSSRALVVLLALFLDAMAVLLVLK